MVNLVVVALLFTSCASMKKVYHDKFQLLCKRQDGTHFPMANLKFIVSKKTNADTTSDDAGLFDKAWGSILDFADRTPKDVQGSTLTSEGYSGRWNNDHYNWDDSTKVIYVFHIDCNAPYRSQCPAIDNTCKIDGRNAYTTWLDYDENKLYFDRGYCSFYTAQNLNCGQSHVTLDRNPMTKDEFCTPPPRKTLSECNFDPAKSVAPAAGPGTAEGSSNSDRQKGNNTATAAAGAISVAASGILATFSLLVLI